MKGIEVTCVVTLGVASKRLTWMVKLDVEGALGEEYEAEGRIFRWRGNVRSMGRDGDMASYHHH